MLLCIGTKSLKNYYMSILDEESFNLVSNQNSDGFYIFAHLNLLSLYKTNAVIKKLYIRVILKIVVFFIKINNTLVLKYFSVNLFFINAYFSFKVPVFFLYEYKYLFNL